MDFCNVQHFVSDVPKKKPSPLKSAFRKVTPPLKTASINIVALCVSGRYALNPIISNDIAATVAVQTILQTPSPHYAMA
jgi:hypothetical protein